MLNSHVTKHLHITCLFVSCQHPWKVEYSALLISLLHLLSVISSFEVEILKNTLVGLIVVMYLGNVVEEK